MACTLAAMTSWCCVSVVRLRRVRLSDERETHRHVRMLGRQQRLTLFAMMLTAAALLALITLPTGINPDLRDLRRANASCGERESPYDAPTCYAMQPGGTWVIEELHSDGARWVIATVTHPDFKKNP